MSRSTRTIVTLCAALASTVACGNGKSTADAGPDQTQVAPSDVRGTVWGEVDDAATGAPLEGASVSLAIGSSALQATTDASGAFSFQGVPAGGQAGVTISKDGYSRVTLQVGIPGNTGNFPADGIGTFVGPVGLFPLTGRIDAQVIGYDATPIDAATGVAQAPAYLLYGGLQGSLTVSAASASGTMPFQGLPSLAALALKGARITLVVSPVDSDGDGLIDYQGVRKQFDAETLLTRGGRVTLELPPAGGSSNLKVIASNVASILNNGVPQPGGSVIDVNDPIRVVYNQTLDPSTLDALLFDATADNVIESTAEVRDGNVVLVSPVTPFVEGSKYHILIDVRSAGTTANTQALRSYGTFFTTSSNAEVTATYQLADSNGDGALSAGDQIDVTLNIEAGLGGGQAGYWFPVYFDKDIDGSNAIGDFVGECSTTTNECADTPIQAVEIESAPRTPFSKSGFTRHFRLTMPYAPRNPYYQIPQNASLPVLLDFSRTVVGYQRLLDPSGRPIRTPSAPSTMVVTFQ